MTETRLKLIGSRLATAIRNSGGLTVINQKVNVSSRSISRYISGDSEMPILAAQDLANATNVSLNWLLTGNSDSQIVSFEDEIDTEVSQSDSKEEWLRRGEDSNLIYLPLLNVVASAGAGNANDDVAVIRRLPFTRGLLRENGISASNAHFITAKGDSMEPTIHNGSVVLLDVSRRDLRDPGIYVLTVDSDLLIKRVYPSAKGLMLVSDNRERYPAEVLDRSDVDRVNVVGKVFWVGSAL